MHEDCWKALADKENLNPQKNSSKIEKFVRLTSGRVAWVHCERRGGLFNINISALAFLSYVPRQRELQRKRRDFE